MAYSGNFSCYDIPSSDPTNIAWDWQTCTEMVIPIWTGYNNDTMFVPDHFDMNQYLEYCNYSYGVQPRIHWITTYYGGHDIKSILKRFGSNIIFSNGLRDPYSIGGVLQNISDTILAVYTPKGSHCLDLHGAKKTDPAWLTQQRDTEVKIIQSWITKQ
ncbi:unnamed protein product [Cuscuta epithymum]|nr:unnamed protein product [Cuscuta epithymum]